MSPLLILDRRAPNLGITLKTRARRKRLAASLAAALALGDVGAAPYDPRALPRDGATIDTADRDAAARWYAMRWSPDKPRPAGHSVVTNCEDAGPGSLRDAVQNAVDGDTVDLAKLMCSTITLTSGEIVVQVDHLALQGPGPGLAPRSLTIDGSHNDRLFSFWGGYGASVPSAFFVINDLILTNGFKGGNAFGGCVYGLSPNPNALILLARSTVTGCTVGDASSQVASGGGIYTRGSLALYSTTVSNNVAVIGPGGNESAFGGAGAVYTITVADSTITGNRADVSDAGGFALVGGIGGMGGVPPNPYFSPRYSSVIRSTIDANSSASEGGGLFFNAPLGYTVTVAPLVLDSTISGNTAPTSAGVYASSYFENAGITLMIWNSTIAFNSATESGCGGLSSIGRGPISADLESTIVADNDGPANAPADICGTAVLSGANNLIVVSSIAVPVGTLRADPLLGPLQNNGGRTSTHGLRPGSPAIDAGYSYSIVTDDQRGEGFPRVVGAAADIGAYEVQVDLDDIIFANGFE